MNAKTTDNTDNTAAVMAFIAHIGDIATIAARLSEYAEDHGGIAPDDVTWSNVADLGEIVKALRSATRWAGIDLDAEEAAEIADWHYMMDAEYAEADEDPALLKL